MDLLTIDKSKQDNINSFRTEYVQTLVKPIGVNFLCRHRILLHINLVSCDLIWWLK